MILVYLCIVLFTLGYVFVDKFFKRKQHFEKLLRNIPTTKQIKCDPIVGHALHLKDFFNDVINKPNLVNFQNTPFKAWFMNDPLVFLFRPEDVYAALKSTKCLKKHWVYDFMKNAVGDSLPVSQIQKWKKNRKIVMQTFHKSILDEFISIYSEKTVILIEILRTKEGKMTDIYDDLFSCMVDVLCSTAFNVAVDVQRNPNQFFIDAIKREREILHKRITNPLYGNNFFYKFTSMYREEKRNMRWMIDLYNTVFTPRRKEAEKLYEEDSLSKMKLYDHLVRVQKTSDNFTDTDLMDEIRAFTMVGSETTSLSMSYILIMLGMHQNIQKKLYDEVIRVVGTERNVEVIDMPNLMYTEQVVKETIRLFPIGSLILREATEDVEIGKYILPKGCGIFLSLIGMMRNEDYYKDALKFVPERFSPEEAHKLYPNSYFPFSGGPRNCIGKNYAMDEMKTITAMLVREFIIETSFKTIEEITIDFTITSNSTKGYPIKLSSRNHNSQ